MDRQYYNNNAQSPEYRNNYQSPLYQPIQDNPYQRSPVYNTYNESSPYYNYYSPDAPSYPDFYNQLPPPIYDNFNNNNNNTYWENRVLSVEIEKDSTISEIEVAFSRYNGRISYQMTATGSYYVTINFPNSTSIHAAFQNLNNSNINGENIRLSFPPPSNDTPNYGYTYSRSLSDTGLRQTASQAKLPAPIGPKKSESYHNLVSPTVNTGWTDSISSSTVKSAWTDSLSLFGGHHNETNSATSNTSKTESPLRTGSQPNLTIRKPSETSGDSEKSSASLFYSQVVSGETNKKDAGKIRAQSEPALQSLTSTPPTSTKSGLSSSNGTTSTEKSKPPSKPPTSSHNNYSFNSSHPPPARRKNSDHVGGSITASGRVRTAHSEIDPTSFTLVLEKVQNDEDKRTTLMVRNIPNKYKPKMLLTEIDQFYKGTYDFFYLPIDFKNKCNVGYAFINFIDVFKYLFIV